MNGDDDAPDPPLPKLPHSFPPLPLSQFQNPVHGTSEIELPDTPPSEVEDDIEMRVPVPEEYAPSVGAPIVSQTMSANVDGDCIPKIVAEVVIYTENTRLKELGTPTLQP